MSAPEQPMHTPRALRPVMGSFRIMAERIMAKMGSDVVTMLALEGDVMLNPIVKQHWLPISPSNPAPQKAKMSFRGTCSRLTNNDTIQKNNAPPKARMNTRLRLSTPLSMASLPIGDMSPQQMLAERMQA